MKRIIEIKDRLKEIDDIEIHDTFSADRCYFKKKDYELMVKINILVASRECELSIYNRPTGQWTSIYYAKDVDELIEYINGI